MKNLIKNTIVKQFKNYAFDNGFPIENLLDIVAIILRDEAIKELKIQEEKK